MTFDAGKNCFCMVSTFDGERDNFKIVCIDFAANCRCSFACKVVSKRRTGGTAAYSERIVCFTDAELVGLFKVHVFVS